jgi:hypothetical protein
MMMLIQNQRMQAHLMVVMVYLVQSLDLQSQEAVEEEVVVMLLNQMKEDVVEQVVVEEEPIVVYQLQGHLL